MTQHKFNPDEEQLQLICFVLQGKTNAQIAELLGHITKDGVKMRLRFLCRRIGVKNRFELRKKATEECWGVPPPNHNIDMSSCKNSHNCQIVKVLKERLNEKAG